MKEIGIDGKVITTFHGYDMSAFVKKQGRDVYRGLFSTGDLFMPISDHWKNKLIEMGCQAQKVIVHRMGINLGSFRFSERKPGGTIKILSVGRLTEKKGHEYAIKAIKKLSKDINNIEYIIAGDGPLKKKLQKMVSGLDIKDKTKFLGPVSQKSVRQLYEQAHIFLHPSVTADNGDQEGIPVVLMEAMATGLPVISTLHSGIPELVEDGVSGFLVLEKDEEALVGKMKFVIEHPEKWAEIGSWARKTVEERYNIVKLNKELTHMYGNLLGEKTIC
jgi:colanic acid/amylovoran biosynthesis glycosyltransferase